MDPITDTPAADSTTESAPQADTEPDPRDDYIESLKDEAIKNRHKAKKVDDANARMVRLVAASDGRLVDADLVPMSDTLLDDDGLVDPAKVTEAIDALLAAKPLLRKQVPSAPLPGQGAVTEAPAPKGIFDVFLGR